MTVVLTYKRKRGGYFTRRIEACGAFAAKVLSSLRAELRRSPEARQAYLVTVNAWGGWHWPPIKMRLAAAEVSE